MADLTPTFQGEVQFRRWSDSSTQGVQVTFALADSSELEPLKAKAGKRFMAVLVEIGDDEQPVAPQRKDTRGPLCREACDYSKNREFLRWVASDEEEFATESEAREFILNLCGVLSRKELDQQPTAAKRFIEEVRIPFFRWQRKQAHPRALANAGY